MGKMGRPKEVEDVQIVAAARRCFLKYGAGVSAADIAREVGLSHTTLFNRFGSKEGLLLAALGPPQEIDWVSALEAGPDARSIRVQLVEHALAMSEFFQDLQAGFSVLQAAGVDPGKAYRARKGESAPEKAYRALVEWLDRAQKQRRLGKCDTATLASTVLAALQGWAVTMRVCGESASGVASERYVEDLMALLWTGIGTDRK